MAVFTADKVVRTLTIHKDGCRHSNKPDLRPCGCGETGEKGNQRWWCEDHIILDEINQLMNNRQWAILLCTECFGIP